jgi:hypothetical protein
MNHSIKRGFANPDDTCIRIEVSGVGAFAIEQLDKLEEEARNKWDIHGCSVDSSGIETDGRKQKTISFRYLYGTPKKKPITKSIPNHDLKRISANDLDPY